MYVVVKFGSLSQKSYRICTSNVFLSFILLISLIVRIMYFSMV